MSELSDLLKNLREVADSEDWHERESAGFEVRDLMERQFDEVFELTADWVSDESERVRRAACLSCMQRKKHTDARRVAKLLDRLAVIMEDDSLYVRKCCGPFVVGYLGYTYPSQALPWLEEMSRSSDFNVRTNVAKAFTQALGRRHPEEGMPILALLIRDGNNRVRAAAEAAIRNVNEGRERA